MIVPKPPDGWRFLKETDSHEVYTTGGREFEVRIEKVDRRGIKRVELYQTLVHPDASYGETRIWWSTYLGRDDAKQQGQRLMNNHLYYYERWQSGEKP